MGLSDVYVLDKISTIDCAVVWRSFKIYFHHYVFLLKLVGFEGLCIRIKNKSAKTATWTTEHELLLTIYYYPRYYWYWDIEQYNKIYTASLSTFFCVHKTCIFRLVCTSAFICCVFVCFVIVHMFPLSETGQSYTKKNIDKSWKVSERVREIWNERTKRCFTKKRLFTFAASSAMR